VTTRTLRVMVVVDDDDEMRLLINRVLSSDPSLELSGEATTAAQAVEEARRLDPSLIILDHYIEGDVMGLQAAPMIHNVAPDAKILVFSNHDLASECEREPAVDAFLPKRRLTDLLATVQELLGVA
jgi:DNA-binding NarL/FixJ family response regulator